jgi:AbrB family looped-hinge helix DNA binding protein
MERTLVVQPDGQITLPAEWLEKHGIEPGSELVVIEDEYDGLLVLPREAAAMLLLDRIGKELKAKGVTLEEMMESGEEIRQQIYDERHANPEPPSP